LSLIRVRWTDPLERKHRRVTQCSMAQPCCQSRRYFVPLPVSRKVHRLALAHSQLGDALHLLGVRHAAAILALQAGQGPESTTPYAGSNITGPSGLIAVDKVGNHIRFYDPESLRELKSFAAPEPAAHELAISHDRRTAFVPLYGDGIYGANKNPNNKILV